MINYTNDTAPSSKMVVFWVQTYVMPLIAVCANVVKKFCAPQHRDLYRGFAKAFLKQAA
jgi:hypothetical protein